MSAPWRSQLRWALWSAVLALACVQWSLLGAGWTVEVPDVFGFRGYHGLFAALLATCALLIAARQPANPIGWLFYLAALSMALSGAANGYALRALLAEPGSLPAGEQAAWFASWVTTPVLAMAIPGLVLFPYGRLPTPRWHVVVLVSGPAIAWMMAGQALAPGPLIDATFVDNPYGVNSVPGLPTLVSELALNGGFILVLFVLLPLCAWAPIWRFRHAGPVERQQLKWLGAAGVLLAALQLPVNLLAEMDAGIASEIAEVVFVAALFGFPLAVTVAILRYRLYDVDVIINRTLVYGSLTIAIVAIYAVFVVGLGWLLRYFSGQGSNELAVAGTTLLVAALFQPARRRIQTAVDRRFYRSRYDAARALDEFQQHLRHQTDLDSLRLEIAHAASQTLRPAHVSVWLWEKGGE